MIEHNLPDKDDAPWLDCMDGFKEAHKPRSTYHGDKQEEAFVEWFHDDYGQFSLRSEAFFTDCLVGDEKTRQDILYKWVTCAFMAGYKEGKVNESTY